MQIFSNEGLKIVQDVKMGRGKMQTASGLMQIADHFVQPRRAEQIFAAGGAHLRRLHNLFNYIHTHVLSAFSIYINARRAPEREIRCFD
jgi:hypothetical protein